MTTFKKQMMVKYFNRQVDAPKFRCDAILGISKDTPILDTLKETFPENQISKIIQSYCGSDKHFLFSVHGFLKIK